MATDGTPPPGDGLDPRNLPRPKPLPTNKTGHPDIPAVPSATDAELEVQEDEEGMARGLVLGLLMGAVLLGAALAGVVAYALSQNDDTLQLTTPSPTVTTVEVTEPTAEPEPDPTAVPEPTEAPTAEPEPTPEPTAAPTPEPTAAPTPEPTAAPTAEPTPEPTEEPVPVPTGEVEESVGYVRNGQIFLEGAVPDQESADAIVELAGSILGPDNVINNYVIDPRAGDPGEGRVIVEDAVLFATGSDEIDPAFEPLLNQGLALLLVVPDATMTVFGHTDSVGSDENNQVLSEDRAEAVLAYWTARGVDPARLDAVGLGESEPRETNDTTEGRAANRRIEVIIENLLSASE